MYNIMRHNILQNDLLKKTFYVFVLFLMVGNYRKSGLYSFNNCNQNKLY